MKNKILVFIVSIVLVATFQIPCVKASEPMPDLVIISIWKEGDMIWYQLRNVGDAVAPDGHQTFLYVDGDYVGRDLVDRALTPGERYTGSYVYEETPSEDRVVVWADYYNIVVESSESNNRMEQIFICDVKSPEIVSGPTVQDLSQTSAIIIWETDEDSDSLVKYGRAAGEFELQKAYDSFVRSHSIALAELEPSSTYHFVVQSTDPDGNSVQSADRIFETLPLADGEDPVVSIVDPGICKGQVTLSAKASDNVGIDRVEFFINNEHVYTDYSASSDFQCDWLTELFANGAYVAKVIAYDISGGHSQSEILVEVANDKDPTVPEVTIGYPAMYAVVAKEIGIVVWVKDDNGISKVQCLIDGKPFQTYTYAPPYTPKDLSFTMSTNPIWWDTRAWPDGTHRIGINATDVDGKSGLGYVDVKVNNGTPTPAPGLIVEDHKVLRDANEFTIELTVKCTETAPWGVKNVLITEFLSGFQPISQKTNFADYVAHLDVQSKKLADTIYAYNAVGTCNISVSDILSGYSVTFVYFAVPVMIYPKDPNAPMPSIGDSIKLSYYNMLTQTQENYETKVGQIARQESTGNQEPISTAYDDALKGADYLIVTCPDKIADQQQPTETDRLFSDMADLARWHRSAVLGYIYPKNPDSPTIEEDKRDTLVNLINPAGEWAKKLHPNFSSPLSGYLLIVGEDSIVPAWQEEYLNPNPSSPPIPIPVSDFRYSQRGGSPPDLIVGRIIGDGAAGLSKSIQTCISTLKLKLFDRSDALVISGEGQGKTTEEESQTFKNEATQWANLLSSKGYKVDSVYWPDYTGSIQYFNDFKLKAKDKDVILYNGHGAPDTWWPVPINTNIPSVNFGNAKPFVFADACETGDYARAVGSIAKAFLKQGASIYIGATAPDYEKGPGVYGIFSNWDVSESVGKAFYEAKKNCWGTTNGVTFCKLYNLYGDPKLGITQTLGGAGSTSEAILPSSPPTTIEVEVPDYIVDRNFYGDGLDYVHIPDGLVWFERGQLQVPIYSVLLDYPQGYEINNVILDQRNGMVMDTGLNIPMTSLELTPSSFNSVPYSGTVADWFPQKEYTWKAEENSDGTKTLFITMYPFQYNPLTSMARFYKNYAFNIDCTFSQVGVNGIGTQKDAYQQGDLIAFNIDLENDGEPQDVAIQALIKKCGEETVVDGLLLRTLRNCVDLCSYTPKWDTTTFDPGDYCIEVTLTDHLGNLLDRKTETFRLGTSSGVVTSLTATPRYFHIGDAIEVNMKFDNVGTIPISGVAKIEVFNSLGTIVDEYQHDIAYLMPSESIGLSNTWDTSGVEESSYNIVGYVLYDGKASKPMTVTVETDYTLPSVNVQTPLEGQALQDGVTLKASVSDPSGIDWVTFSIRELDGTVIDPAFESMSPTYVGSDMWQLHFNTNQPKLPDGYYMFIANASDMVGNEGSATVQFSVCNWACLKLLPATSSSKAGRTMPIKFSLRVAASVDSAQPFVWNEELTIKIYQKGYPEKILQTSIYGTGARNYRIDPVAELYITNFKTLTIPKTYVVEIYRKGMLIGTFTFSTVK